MGLWIEANGIYDSLYWLSGMRGMLDEHYRQEGRASSSNIYSWLDKACERGQKSIGRKIRTISKDNTFRPLLALYVTVPHALHYPTSRHLKYRGKPTLAWLCYPGKRPV